MKLPNCCKILKSKDMCNTSSENIGFEKMPFEKKKLQNEIAELRRKFQQSKKTIAKLEKELAKSKNDLTITKEENKNLQEIVIFFEDKSSKLEKEVSRLQSLKNKPLEYNKQQEGFVTQEPEVKQEIKKTETTQRKRKISSDNAVVSSSVKSPGPVPLYRYFVPAHSPEPQSKKGFSEGHSDVKSNAWKGILDSKSSKIDDETSSNPQLVENHCLGHEAEDFEFDLAEIKKSLGLLDVNSVPLSPIPSPVKKKPPSPFEFPQKAAEHANLHSFQNSDPPSLASFNNSPTTICNNVLEENASVQNKTDSLSDFAVEVKKPSLGSTKRKGMVFYTTNKHSGPLPGPSLCFKRRKILKSNAIPPKDSSSEFPSTISSDFVEGDSSSSQSADCSKSGTPVSSLDLESSNFVAFEVPEVTSCRASKPSDGKAGGLFVTAAQSSNKVTPTSNKTISVNSELKSNSAISKVQSETDSSKEVRINDVALGSAKKRISHFNKSRGSLSASCLKRPCSDVMRNSTDKTSSNSEKVDSVLCPSSLRSPSSVTLGSMPKSNAETDNDITVQTETDSPSESSVEVCNTTSGSAKVASPVVPESGPSHCASEPGVDDGTAVDTVIAAAKRYNVLRGHALNSKGKRAKKNNKNNTSKETNPIEEALRSLKCSTSGGTWSKQSLRALVNILINPKLIPDKPSLLLQVLGFSCSSSNADVSDFNSAYFSLLEAEKAVIASLQEVDRMGKPCLKDLLASALESMHPLIANKADLRLKELCSLCRVYAGICRAGDVARSPVLLALDFLRTRHRFSAMMVASVVGVWSRPFEMDESMSDEEKCLHSAIAFAAFKKPKSLTHNYWNSCAEFLSERITPAPDTEVVKEVLQFLFAKIHMECANGSPPDMEYTLLAPVIIFAAFSEWDWAKENILDKYVVPSLSKYAVQEPNEAAFGVFSHLYAEIFSFCPGKPDDSVLKIYFSEEGTLRGQSFVKDWAAVAYIRLLVLQKKAISKDFFNWLQENVHNPKAESLMSWLKIKTLTLIRGLTKEDILI